MIHGDASRGNIIHDGGRFALIDFGDAGAGSRIADVAIAIAQLALAGGRLRPEIWSALWAGFAEIADPSDPERAAVLEERRLVPIRVREADARLRAEEIARHRAASA